MKRVIEILEVVGKDEDYGFDIVNTVEHLTIEESNDLKNKMNEDNIKYEVQFGGMILIKTENVLNYILQNVKGLAEYRIHQEIYG